MFKNRYHKPVRLAASAAFAGVVAVNALSMLRPFGAGTPEDVSDLYPNVITPAGPTFSIWGLIYALLACYTVYQLVSKRVPADLVASVNICFTVSSAANILWIFAWSYRLIPLSMLLTVVILVCLLSIVRRVAAQALTLRERFFIKLPFIVYFAWICITAVGNAAVLLVSLGVPSYGPYIESLAILALAGGTILGMWTGIRYKSCAYLLVFMWAYAGLLLRHVSASGFDRQFPRLISASAVCIVFFAVALAAELGAELKARKKQKDSPGRKAPQNDTHNDTSF